MNNKKLHTLIMLVFALLSAGCSHAQLPVTQHSVALTWTAVASGGTSPYSYVMSRYTLTTADAGKCPSVNLATPNYTPLNSASPVSAVSYTDTTVNTASGASFCYEVQSLDSSIPQQVSGPSNVAGPFVIPSVPGTPQSLAGSTAATAKLDKPQLPLWVPYENANAPVVVSQLTGIVR